MSSFLREVVNTGYNMMFPPPSPEADTKDQDKEKEEKVKKEEEEEKQGTILWTWAPSEGATSATPYAWTIEEEKQERPRIFKARLSTKKGKMDIPTADFKTETPSPTVPEKLAFEYLLQKRTENWPSALMVEQTQRKTPKADEVRFEKSDHANVLQPTCFLAMDDAGGASINVCHQDRTISREDAYGHLTRFHNYLVSNWDKFEITPKLDHQQSSPEEKETAAYRSELTPSTSSQSARKRTLGLKPSGIQQALDQEEEDEKMASDAKEMSPKSDAKMKNEERGAKSVECLGSVYDFDPDQIGSTSSTADPFDNLLQSQGVRRSTRATKRTPLFNAHTYNFEHSETSDEDNKMTDFYAGGGANKAPKTYAGAVRRQTSTSSKKTADDSYVAKVTCPGCHKGVPQDDINAHLDLCLKD